MKLRRIDMNQTQQDKVRELTAQGRSQRQIARELGVGRTSVQRALAGKTRPTAEKPTIGPKITKEYGKNKGHISTNSTKWKTLDEAIEAANVDLDVWEVDRYIINSWDVTMKIDETPTTKTNYQIKVWLKRICADSKMEAIEAVVDRLMAKPIKLSNPPKKKQGDVALEICLFDNHFGLLAWEDETGGNYDLKIADTYYMNAVHDLLAKSAHLKIDRIIFPIGQDFFHINSPSMTTPKAHNRLDVDGRFAKVLEAGKMSVLKAIEACRQVATVDVMWIPGNHDPETSYSLIQIAAAYYRNDKRVNVDTSPRARKCVVYGVNAIGLTHGCDEPAKSLPSIFRDDFREWADAKHKEIHIGHTHKKKEMDFVTADTFQKTTVRTIPSLCATDAWHYSKGYIGKIKAAQAFLWHKTDGLLGTLYTYAD